jgi:hypothetical protein
MKREATVAPAITVEELIDELRAHSSSAFVRFELEEGVELGSVVRTYRDGDVVVQLESPDDWGRRRCDHPREDCCDRCCSCRCGDGICCGGTVCRGHAVSGRPQ